MRSLVAVAAVLATLGTVTAIQPPLEFRLLFEKNTGFKVDVLRDLACLAASYDSHLSKGTSGYGCGPFRMRWKPVTAITGINHVKNNEFIGGPHKWFGSDGPHMKVFEGSYLDLHEMIPESSAVADADTTIVVVSFRHQESMSYFNEEMHEAMGLFGRAATVDRKEGARPKAEAAFAAGLIRLSRRLFGMQWFPQVQRMFESVQAHYKALKKPVKYILTGFSLGGVYSTLLSVHAGLTIPVINLAACGVEDVLLEIHPPTTGAVYNVERANSSVNSPKIYNFFHSWDSTPQLDCQIGYVCSWMRRTRPTKETDTDGDGKVDAAHLHPDEVRIDRDGDGDQDADDDLPTAAESELKHLELVFGRFEDSEKGVKVDDDHVPAIFEFLDAPDMLPLCSGGGAYSHVYGSCMRESREWEDRKREFHRWRKQYMHHETMGRPQKRDNSSSAAGDGKHHDKDADLHDLGEMEDDDDDTNDGSGDDKDGDDDKKEDDDDHVWTFAKPAGGDDDHDDL